MLLEIIGFLHPRYPPKKIVDVLKNVQKASVSTSIPRPRTSNGPKYTKYKMCFIIMMVLCIISNAYATFKAQFMKKLSNTRAELKKRSL